MEDTEKDVNGDIALAATRKGLMYLMLERSENTSSTGKWVFPSGKIEDGESKREAALRELEEETGMTGEIVESGDPYISEGELRHHRSSEDLLKADLPEEDCVWRVHPFLVEAEGTVELSEEHSDYTWAQIPGLKSLDTLGNLKSLEKLGVIDD